MKKGYTHIAILLDSSGSMGSIKTDIVGGFNTFIDEQKKLDSETTVTLVQFDSDYRSIYDTIDLKEIKELTISDYTTGGLTALNDSLATLINATGKQLAALPEEERPEKVLLVAITDGYENASKEYSTSQVKDMIKHQEDIYNWSVAYIGANQDSFAEAKTRGMSAALNFTADSKGIDTMYKSLSRSTVSYRSDNSIGSKFDFLQHAVQAQEDKNQNASIKSL